MVVSGYHYCRQQFLALSEQKNRIENSPLNYDVRNKIDHILRTLVAIS